MQEEVGFDHPAGKGDLKDKIQDHQQYAEQRQKPFTSSKKGGCLVDELREPGDHCRNALFLFLQQKWLVASEQPTRDQAFHHHPAAAVFHVRYLSLFVE